MSLKVYYNGDTVINETADCTKVIKSKGKYLEDDVIIEYTGGGSEIEPVYNFNKTQFFDYDGTLLYQYSLAEIQSLEELPTPPKHEGLSFLEWNWTLAELKTENEPMIVGANYKTVDGHTRFYINIPNENLLNINFQIQGDSGTLTIDWGDNTSSDSFICRSNAQDNIVANHIYSSIGNYVITLSMTEGGFLSCRSNTPLFVDATKAGSDVSSAYDISGVLITKIEAGTEELKGYQSNGWGAAFANLFRCKSISISNKNWLATVTNSDSVPSIGNTSVLFLAVPRECTKNSVMQSKRNITQAIPKSCATFVSCNNSSLFAISFPNGITTLNNSALANTKIMSVKLPNTITNIGNMAFDGLQCAKYYDFTEWSVTDIDNCTFGSQIFRYITTGTEIRFKYKSVADHAATVTNLSTYASYMTYEEDDT